MGRLFRLAKRDGKGVAAEAQWRHADITEDIASIAVLSLRACFSFKNNYNDVLFFGC